MIRPVSVHYFELAGFSRVRHSYSFDSFARDFGDGGGLHPSCVVQQASSPCCFQRDVVEVRRRAAGQSLLHIFIPFFFLFFRFLIIFSLSCRCPPYFLSHCYVFCLYCLHFEASSLHTCTAIPSSLLLAQHSR